jgi:hypothetical protein
MNDIIIGILQDGLSTILQACCKRLPVAATDIAGMLLNLVLDFVPHQKAAEQLDAAARARIDAKVDVLEEEKLAGSTD